MARQGSAGCAANQEFVGQLRLERSSDPFFIIAVGG